MTTKNVVQHQHQHQHQFIEALVTSGRYQNANEVLREGLRLLERQESEDAAKIAALRAAAETGWEDVASRRCTEIPDEALDDFIASSASKLLAGSRLGDGAIPDLPSGPARR